MVKNTVILAVVISSLIILSTFSGVNAFSNNSNRHLGGAGAGTFVHDHEGQPHNHFFAFTVSNGKLASDGWLYNPNGRFYLIATHDKEVHLLVKTEQLTRYKVTAGSEGVMIVFEGTATVNHHNEGWTSGWQLTVEATDNSPKGAGKDTIHVMLTSPTGEEHHMDGLLRSGNIAIRN